MDGCFVDAVALGAADEKHVLPRRVDGRPRRGNALDSQRQRVDAFAAPVLDRHPRYASVDGQGDVGRNPLWTVGETRLEVGIDRQVGGCTQQTQMV